MADGLGALRAVFSVSVAGVEVTERINPYVVALDVQQTAAGGADTATIDLADDYGRLAMPGNGEAVEISLGWEGVGVGLVFTGTVDHCESVGGRDGRFLRVRVVGTDNFGNAKTPQQGHLDNGSLGEAAEKFGGAAGLSVAVHSTLASITRDWWGINNESFIHWGQRVASEVGGLFKVIGSRAIFLPGLGTESASGASLGGIVATAGRNMISWNIAPVMGRPPHASFVGRFFDLAAAEWKKVEASSLMRTIAKATGVNRFAAVDHAGAEQTATGAAANQFDGAGTGSVTIIGDPAARPDATLTVQGARDGIDGDYVIEEAEHRFSRGGGYLTIVKVRPSASGNGTWLTMPTVLPQVGGFPG